MEELEKIIKETEEPQGATLEAVEADIRMIYAETTSEKTDKLTEKEKALIREMKPHPAEITKRATITPKVTEEYKPRENLESKTQEIPPTEIILHNQGTKGLETIATQETNPSTLETIGLTIKDYLSATKDVTKDIASKTAGFVKKIYPGAKFHGSWLFALPSFVYNEGNERYEGNLTINYKNIKENSEKVKEKIIVGAIGNTIGGIISTLGYLIITQPNPVTFTTFPEALAPLAATNVASGLYEIGSAIARRAKSYNTLICINDDCSIDMIKELRGRDPDQYCPRCGEDQKS